MTLRDRIFQRQGIRQRKPASPSVAELLAEDRQREATKAASEDAPAPARATKPDAAARQAAHAARNAAEQEQAAQRRAAKAAAERERQERSRLPHGATFHVEYDAAAVLWRGSLSVEGRTFTGEASAVFRLLRSLDDAYRASLQETPA